MLKPNFSQFFQNQKSRFASFRQKKDVAVLDSKFNLFLDVLRKIDSHLDYESELAEKNVDEDFIAKLNLDSYLPKLNRKILLPLKDKKNLCLKFFQLLICFNFSDFKHINEKIYAALLFKMISLAAENDSCERNEFVRQIYEFKCEEANLEKVQDFIKKMLQIAKDDEEKSQNKPKNDKTEQKSQDKKDENSEQTDFFAETKDDARGIKIISGLLFQYNIDDSEDLRKMFSKTNLLHFFFWIIIPLALAIFGIFFYAGFFDKGIFYKKVQIFSDFLSNLILKRQDYNFKNFFLPSIVFSLTFFFVILAISNSIIFFFRKQRTKYLKKAISKIAGVCEINEDYIYKRLLPRYGTKIKKLLQ